VGGTPYLLPFETSPDAEAYAAKIAAAKLATSGTFYIYGGDINVHKWQKWFAERDELRAWRSRRLGSFGDVEVVLFEKGP
jgi:hypothetical protein